VKLSLKIKASISVAVIIILVTAAGTWFFLTASHRGLEKRLIARGEALSHSLARAAEEGLVSESLDLIKKAEYIVHAEDAMLVQIYSTIWDAVDAYPFERLKDPPAPEAIEHFKNTNGLFYQKIDGGYDFYAPALFKSHADAPEIVIGFVRLTLSSSAMQEEIQEALVGNLVTAAILTLIIIVILNMVINSLVIDPLTRLQKSIMTFKSGALPPVVPVRSRDEIGELISAFNQMAETINKDSADLRAAEKKIFEAMDDWKSTFNAITDVITIHDMDFNIIHANKAAEKVLGLPALDGAPVKCYLYYHGRRLSDKGCPVAESLKKGKPFTAEVYEPHLNMFVEIRAIPRFDANGNIAGSIHVVRDITEHKKLEDQLRQAQKMEAIGQLAGGIAHDFNNILTAIIGYANILKMKVGKDDPLILNIEPIIASSQRGANLTQSLLAFSRQQISNPEKINVNDIITSMEKLLVRVISEDIELKTILNSPFDREGRITEPVIMADRGQIDQVLMNLCTNARDAMPEGGTLIIETDLLNLDREFTTAHGYGKPGSYAVISVSDTGTGISEKVRGKIFDPFFTTKEVGKGTGLGLSIVYGIVKQHNGYITCYSEPGSGTTFKIYIPAIKSEADKETTSVETPEFTQATETVLLAEDEAEVRKLTKQILDDTGYKVIEAVNGEDAVDRFIENKDAIELLIMDVIMPKMNGKEAYDRIKKIRPNIRVLFISGYPAHFINKNGMIDKGLDIIAKPVSPVALLKKVKEVLGK